MNFKDTLIISFYRFVVAPLGLTALVFLVLPFNKKVRRTLGMKFHPCTRFSKHALWFHSASGEFEYCKPLIRTLNESFPDERIFCSYTSESYALRVQKYQGVDGYGPLPLDLPGPVRQFLKDLRPKALLIAKTDLWPELIFQCWEKKIPVIAFAVVAKNSSSPFLFFKRWMYNKCEKVLCMTDDDASNLRKMGVTTPVQVTGDPRIDQIMDRVRAPESPVPGFLNSSDPTLTIGSSWPEDEKEILDSVLDQVNAANLRVFINPHEPSEEHYENLKKKCDHIGVKLKKYSEIQSWGPQTMVYGDTIGVLADLYARSNIAFVGGSFKSQVHSVGEAIGHGNRVIVGPKNQNNREAQIFKAQSVSDRPIVSEVRNKQEFHAMLKELLSIPEQLTSDRAQIQAEFRKHTGATLKTLSQIKNILP